MSWGYYPPYVSVAEKKIKAEKKLKQLRKKYPDIQPIVIEGKTLAITWWGKAWNANLKKYADYSNRIGRGRSYVKQGAVLDLKLTKGKIESLVLGSETQPYFIQIKVGKLSTKKWDTIKKAAKDKIESLQELLDGKFPKELEEIFTAKGAGLFPSPKEIKLDCSCPDWATMCKHVTATLYGIGVRLDQNPALFFTLRGVNIDDLVGSALKKRKEELLQSISNKKKGPRVIEGGEDKLSALFDIDFAESKPIAAEEKSVKKKTKKKTTKKKIKKIAKKTAKKTPARKANKKKTAKKKLSKNPARRHQGKRLQKRNAVGKIRNILIVDVIIPFCFFVR